ncbi:MAG: cytochrome c oxidase assembly protein [Acidobacteria bacterium]|nr:cytochrome c oxidase assembly protein [Acidobacteriota bacterium]
MPASSNVLFALMHPAERAAHGHAAAHAWTIEPGVVLPLVVMLSLYLVGVWRLWRGGRSGTGVRVWQVAAFVSGCIAVMLALVSPIAAMSAELSSAHMVQHELLIVVAAPLLVVGTPLVPLMMALSQPMRVRLVRLLHAPPVRRTWHVLTVPVTVWLLHALALWTWHVPVLYEAALANDVIHAAEHACFFVTALLFWWGIAGGRYGRARYGAAVVYVFATALHSGLLGAALTLSPTVWYDAYASTTTAWGLTALEDQQAAGLIMWVPAGLVFTGVGLAFFAAWLRASERRSRFVRAGAVPVLLLLVGLSWGCGPDVRAEASAMTGGDPDRGRQAIDRYGCGTCHVIAGVATARGLVGPPLTGVASRVYLAGHLPNEPDTMVDWIQHPHAHDPKTVMPETGITAQDARDVAAYLYTLR